MTDLQTIGLNLEKPQPEILTNTQNYQLKLKQSEEVKQLTSQININDVQSILNFGQQPAEELSRISDQLLNQTQRVNDDEASQMFRKLTNVLNTVDIKELDLNQIEQKGLFNKLMDNTKRKLDKLKAKYEKVGKDVTEIEIMLHAFEGQLVQMLTDLQLQYDANLNYFKALEQYVVAGEIAQDEIEAFKQNFKNQPLDEQQKQMTLAQLEETQQMLAQRVMSLRMAETVALQNGPIIHMMQRNAFSLIRQIKDSMIISLPIFKSAIIQMIEMKRQAMISQSVNELNKTTNALYEKMTQNVAQQTILNAQRENQTALTIDTITNSYNTLKQGVTEATKIRENASMQRQKDTQTLSQLKTQMLSEGFIK